MSVRFEDLQSLVQPGGVLTAADLLDKLSDVLTISQKEKLVSSLNLNSLVDVYPGSLITTEWAIAIQNAIARLEEIIGTEIENDEVVLVLTNAWAAYRGLSTMGKFTPGTSTADAILGTIRIKGYFDNVAMVALLGRVSATASVTNKALQMFELLYEVEHELVLAFLSPLPGVVDASSHHLFSNALLPLLDQVGPPGLTPLKVAIDNSDLDSAVAAQNRINNIVVNFGGETVSGNLHVTYRGSGPEGETFVIDSTKTFTFKFDIENRTNRALKVDLQAEFLDTHTNWTQNISIINASGNAITQISLEKFDATKTTGWVEQIRVAASTPDGVIAGQIGILRVIASVPEPVGISHFDQHPIAVTDAQTPTLPASLSFTASSPVPSQDPAHAEETTRLTLSYGAILSVQQGATTRDCIFQLNIDEPAAPDDFFEIALKPNLIDVVSSTATKKVSLPFPLTHGASPVTLLVTVKPKPGSLNKVLKFKALIKCVTEPTIFFETNQTVISVTQAAPP